MNFFRESIVSLSPYRSARDEYEGNALIMLDANENSYFSRSGLNRYPDPQQQELKRKIGGLKRIPIESILLGNGSDEIIDLLIRSTVEPRTGEIIICPPTYGMYRVLGDINGAQIVEAPLLENFSLDVAKILSVISDDTKLIFICSPNNPTGNLISLEQIREILRATPCIVVVDEAYIDFAESDSTITLLGEFKNLCVLQTFSKAWGLAGARLGVLYADASIIAVLNKVKYPYNVNSLTQAKVGEVIDKADEIQRTVTAICRERNRLMQSLSDLPIVERVFPSDANFILVRFHDSREVFNSLLSCGIVVRERSNEIRCENCLRVTVGTELENNALLRCLREIKV